MALGVICSARLSPEGEGAAYLARRGTAGRRHAGPGVCSRRPRTGLPSGDLSAAAVGSSA